MCCTAIALWISLSGVIFGSWNQKSEGIPAVGQGSMVSYRRLTIVIEILLGVALLTHLC